MNYEEAFNQTGWDLIQSLWWVGLFVLGWIARKYARWIAPK